MPAPPVATDLGDTYPNPSNATFKAAILALRAYAVGLLGATGNAAEARTALAIGPVISYRNLLINSNFTVNQRAYVSATNTSGSNQYTLDRWRVVTSGQNLTFGAASPDVTATAPAGGIEQVIEGASIAGGVYTLSWTGTATATVNGSAITNGGQTASLAANTNATIKFSSGTVTRAQFELGTVATPWERRPLSLELALCQRYYLPFSYLGGGSCGTNLIQITVPTPVQMRAVPTATNFAAGSGSGAASVYSGTSWFQSSVAANGIAPVGLAANGINCTYPYSGAVAGWPASIAIVGAFSAEL